MAFVLMKSLTTQNGKTDLNAMTYEEIKGHIGRVVGKRKRKPQRWQ